MILEVKIYKVYRDNDTQPALETSDRKRALHALDSMRIRWKLWMAGVVPIRKRFRFEFSASRVHLHLRILVGVVILYMAWRDDCEWLLDAKLNEVTVGWIPWRVREGETVPAWVILRRVIEKPQVPRCPHCSAGLPLIALEEGTSKVWHDAGGGTYHSCSREPS